MDIILFGDRYTHKTSKDELQPLYDAISSSNTYTVQLTYGCGQYSGGYTNQGYIGCISIIKNT